MKRGTLHCYAKKEWLIGVTRKISVTTKGMAISKAEKKYVPI